MTQANEPGSRGTTFWGTLAKGHPSPRMITLGSLALLAFGAWLRVAVYQRNYSLNHDEACLALNIIQRPLAQLAQPLDYLQASPFGFLALEHFAVKIFGASEKALRLLPLICSLVSLPLFWLLARRQIKAWPQWLAVGFFAVSQNLVSMSSWVKQYSAELLVSLVLGLFCEPLLQEAPTRKQLVGCALAGAIALWFSFTACFVLGGLGLACVLAFGWANALRRYAFVFGAWAISFLPIILKVEDSPVRNSMQLIWTPNFIPWSNPRGLAPWLWDGFTNLCDNATSFRLAPLAVLFLGFGLIVGWKRRNYSSLALAFSLLLCLLASGLRQYPFTSRFLFFLAPAVLLLIFAPFNFTVSPVNLLTKRALAIVASLALVYASLSAVKNLILRDTRGDAREALAEIVRQWQPGDKLCLSGAATPLFFYYQHSLGFPSHAHVTQRDPKSHELDRVAPPIPVSPGRHWFIYFPSEAGFAEKIVAHSDLRGKRLGKFDYDTYSAVLWELGGP